MKTIPYYRNFLGKYEHEVQPNKLLASNELEQDSFDVSLAIPSYKRTDLFLRLLDTIEALKGHIRFEVVIAEDTREEEHLLRVQEHLSKCHFKYRYYYNVEQQGLYPNWSQAMHLSKGKYIALVHTDDVLHEGYLLAYEPFLNLGYKAICQKWTYLYVLDHPSAIQDFLSSSQSYPLESSPITALDLCQTGLFVPFLGTLFHRSVFEEVGYFPVGEKWSTDEDYFFMTKVAIASPLHVIDYRGYGYVFEDNFMLSCDGWENCEIERFIMRMEALGKLGIHKPLKYPFYFYIKCMFSISDRDKFLKKYGRNAKKLDRKAIYKTIRMPLFVRLISPMLLLARWIKKTVRHQAD